MRNICISKKVIRVLFALGFVNIMLYAAAANGMAFGIDQYVAGSMPLPLSASPDGSSCTPEPGRSSSLINSIFHQHIFAVLLSLLGMACLVIAASPLMSRYYLPCKRCFDVVISIIALSLLFPVLAVSAVLIKIDSPGPILLRQTRVGVNRRRRCSGPPEERRHCGACGQPFTLYKLRTMRRNAEALTGPVWASENDSRVTRVGRILRKTHVDEIPQFLNVLKGDMCVIGPRPERPLFAGELSHCIRGYAKRLEVKPGITGLAQVRYRYAASVDDARKKLKYDLLYIKKMCLFMDIRILVRTLNTVLYTRGAR